MGRDERIVAIPGTVRRIAVPADPILPGLTVGLYATGRGRFEAAPAPEHRLIVQMGAAAMTDCRVDDQQQTRPQMHGDIDLLPAGSTASWEIDPSAISIRFRFTPALLRRMAADIGLNPDLIDLTPQLQARDAQIEHIASALHAALTTEGSLGRLYGESLGTAFMARAVSRFVAETPVKVKGGLPKRQLQRVIDYVDAFTDEALSLIDLAAIAGVSVSHFKSQFRRSMGVPVHQYVIQRRVEKAKSLLMQGRAISQVALDVGFSHQSHMARCMRRVLGLSPMEVSRLAG
ncbi:MAG: AraC family transcriptional regulator [Rhodospirillales bacterium]|nr:AraC family transcriptional regulator [Rhodospirillales bacterium]